jgi:hypothetical protein
MRFFKWLFADRAVPQAVPKEETPKKSLWEQARDLERQELKRLEELHKDDVDKYIVEVTVKDGTVYKTEPFERSFWAHAQHSYWPTEKIEYLRSGFVSSKEGAESFVNMNTNTKLIRFGDEYVCPKTITKVRLVKI